MSIPQDMGQWKNIYPIEEKFPDLCKQYQAKFNEPFNCAVMAFPFDITIDEFVSTVSNAIETGEELPSYYCGHCHYYEKGRDFTENNPCPQCEYPNIE